ncbi:Non-specific lipid transfer protein GPI-anchored 2 [Carex littledalei]|uniref:Non-specific lipid transfer protein GPI-anchored 2 n=1 Tax=Carex littledalei TaxID=544730 RepID=A0A833QRV9_9POAL|nr:Non-specific lipid transfer protein GPI-anchored 2 [Carex littledalei]
MSQNLSLAFLATIFITTLFAISTNAQSSSSCTSALLGLSPCLNYIGGNDTTPSGSCCSQLASVVQSEPQCLCSVLNGGSSGSLGITINQTRALALPGACKELIIVLALLLIRILTNGGSPAATTPSSTPSTQNPQTDNTGSKDMPNTVIGSSGTTSQKPNFIFFLALLAAASIARIG